MSYWGDNIENFFYFKYDRQATYLPQYFHLWGITLPSWSMQQHSKKHTFFFLKYAPCLLESLRKLVILNFEVIFHRHIEYLQFVLTGLIWWNSAEQGHNFQYLKNTELDELIFVWNTQSSKNIEVLLNSHHCNMQPHQEHSSISDYYCRVSLLFSDTEKKLN